MSVTVLDCTLRDGGYYNNWDFDEATVKKYLAAASAAKIDIVEIGFRFMSSGQFLGAFAYTTDEYLRTLPIPGELQLAVMINAKDLIKHNQGVEVAVNKLFDSCEKSPVDIVRVAAHANEIRECEFLLKRLKELGYNVILNIMQIVFLKPDELRQIVQQVRDWGCIDVLYFADSFGSLDPGAVEDLAKLLVSEWDKEIGFHAHNNKGQALANAMAAVNNGIQYIDGTILGMGRGAGNVLTENILVELNDKNGGNYYPDALFPLVLHEFQELQEKYKWGPNIFYYLSAVHGIHPTYIQEMLCDGRYSTEQILSSINFLKMNSPSNFSAENMLRSTSGGVSGCEKGSWSANGWIDQKTVLILGSGPSINRYSRELIRLIEEINPVVLCLNINHSVPEKYVTAYVACHEMRILFESVQYADLESPIVLPISRVADEIRSTLGKAQVLDYGLKVEDEKFIINDNGCVLPGTFALAYALSVANAGGADRILLAGVDGYAETDPRQKEMIKILDMYDNIQTVKKLISITPTTYPMQKKSIFDPSLTKQDYDQEN